MARTLPARYGFFVYITNFNAFLLRKTNDLTSWWVGRELHIFQNLYLTNVQYGEGHLVPRGPRQEPPFSATPGAQGPKPLFVKEVSVFGVQKFVCEAKE